MTMTKGFITNLTKLEKDPHAPVVSQNLSQVMCSIHNSVKSNSNFPKCDHKMLQLCPNRSYPCHTNHQNQPLRKARKRSKSPRSRSGYREGNKTVTPPTPGQNLTRFRTCAVIQNCPNRDNSPANPPCRKLHCPSFLSSSFAEVEKVNSPNRTCSCLIPASKSTIKTTGPSIKSHSTLEMSHNFLHGKQQVKGHVCTDEIVTELKVEIEKVKSQLHQFSHCSGLNIPGKETVISQLKLENKKLRKELEQRRKDQRCSFKDIEKAKDVMTEYEKKVLLLHQQAVNSSKFLKHSKEKFCKCLKEKENQIKELQRSNKELCDCNKDKEVKYDELCKKYKNLEELFGENREKFEKLEESNQELCNCVRVLNEQLKNSKCDSQQYKEEIKELQKKICNLRCETCPKLEAKTKKQKEKYESILKEYGEKENRLKKEISELSSKIQDANSDKALVKELETKYSDLQNKLTDYEKCALMLKHLEDERRQQQETATAKEKHFENERTEMRRLVDELTNVVKNNKATLLKLSEINKQQEALLESQSTILLQKEEEIKMAKTTIETLSKSSLELETRVVDLERAASGPCSKEVCLTLAKHLEEIRNILNIEKDNRLVKEKIIEDQSQTIYSLQNQIKSKTSDLNQIREEMVTMKHEMTRINSDLFKKEEELEMEHDKNQHLLTKLKKLDNQKSLLSKQLVHLQQLLEYYDSKQCNEEEREAIANLHKQIEQQKREWEEQKASLGKEKEKAVQAARFATQKLLDTVTDFQRQVDTQKKVQNMLTKMVHDKEEELTIIKSKIFSINSITSDLETGGTLKEIFRRTNGLALSNPATSSSLYSCCSNCSKTACYKV